MKLTVSSGLHLDLKLFMCNNLFEVRTLEGLPYTLAVETKTSLSSVRRCSLKI
jgi:hypothetical protein